MIAVRDNPSQAAALGVGVVQTKLTAFVFAGAMAAGAGFLWSTGIGLADSDGLRSGAVAVDRRDRRDRGPRLGRPGRSSASFYFLAFPYFGSGLSQYIGLLASGVGVLLLVLMLPGGFARVLFGARDLLAKVDHRDRRASAGRPDVGRRSRGRRDEGERR